MIVCRRPFKLYDTDVIGLVVLGVIALAACIGVILPARANTTEHRELSDKINAANAAAEQTAQRLHAVNREVGMLQSGILDRALAAPKSDALTPFLQRVASLAIGCDVRIVQVLPYPAQSGDGYLYSDLSFSGRGRCLDFARLLDQLARENPYFSLQDFAIKGAANPTDPSCELSWTLRLRMLEGETSLSTASRATASDKEGRP